MSALWPRPSAGAPWSLQQRVLKICVGALLVSVIVGGSGMYWASLIEDAQSLDTHLEQLGEMVAALADEEAAEHRFDPIESGYAIEPIVLKLSNYRYQVWSRRGILLMRSDQAPGKMPMTDLNHQGFGSFRSNAEDFRVYSTTTKDASSVIQVAETSGSHWAHLSTTAQYFVLAVLLPFAVVAIVIQHLLRLSLRPINAIADQLASRGSSDLGPIRFERPPLELQPILTAVNSLFSRIDHAMATERMFTSVAAHELRTPLAGIRAQSEVALSATTNVERRAALDALVTGVDRSAHMLDQLLDMARVEVLPRGGKMPRESLAFAMVYLDVVTDFGPRAADKQITTRSQFNAEFVSANPFALYLIMRNLVANAILYTPHGGALAIGSTTQADGVVLTVDDSGPGIDQADHDRAFERFNRLGQLGTKGVGLGLSIVMAAVNVHDGRIRLLQSPLGGLRVEVLFTTP